MGQVRVPVVMLALLLASRAFAQEEAGYAAILDEAKAAIAAKDFKAAKALLDKAEQAAGPSAALIQERDLARLPFYRGLVEWRSGDKDTKALNFWRDAITLSADFQPEADVLPESDGQDVYYALIGEVQGRESVTLALPEDPGDTMIFVDGRRMEAFDGVLVGTHFIQLRCGEGNVVGSWYTYGAPPPDYLILCTGGTYPTAKGAKPKATKEPKGPSKADLAKAEKEAAKKAAAEAALADKAAKEAEKTAADKAAADAAAEKAAAQKAAADKAAADKAADEAAGKAAASKAAAEKAATDKAEADKAASDKAASDKAAAEAAAKATSDKAAVDAAAADKAAVDAAKVAADKAAADKATADKATADKATADKARADKATADKATADKAAADKATADKAAEKAAADKVAADNAAGKVAADKAAADKAAAKAAADKAAADKAAADKAAADKATAKAAADKAAADKAAVKTTTKATTKKGASDTLGWAMIAGGGAMIAGGGAVNFLVVNPAWQAAEEANTPASRVPRSEADAIVDQFNGGRYATIGLIAAGIATAGVGVVLGPLDSQVFFTPSGVGLAGRW